MKYPYILSEQRLSIMPPEERQQYDYEHSIFYSKQLREEGVKAYIRCVNESANYFYKEINEDSEYDEMDAKKKLDIAIEAAKFEIKEMYDYTIRFFESTVSKDDMPKELYDNVRRDIYNYYGDIDVRQFITLNEDNIAPGHDMTYWIPSGLILTMLGAIIGLISSGKDYLVAKLLERYMNKIVEEVDDGKYKKKSLFNFFGSKRAGDQSAGCFRAIMEGIERNRYTQSLILAKSFGLVGDNPIQDAASQDMHNGGYENYFEQNIASKIKDLVK